MKIDIKLTVEQQEEFLVKLGYTIIQIHYQVNHDATRSSDEWNTDHLFKFAFKKETMITDRLRQLKETYKELDRFDDYAILEFNHVFETEFSQALYQMVFDEARK
jgi:hypothetical protein